MGIGATGLTPAPYGFTAIGAGDIITMFGLAVIGNKHRHGDEVILPSAIKIAGGRIICILYALAGNPKPYTPS